MPHSASAPTRRQFLQKSALTLLSAPFVTSGLRAASPNGKLRHAAFGGNGMSWADMSSMARHPMWELVAVCDVDTRNFAKVKATFPGVKCYQDWRELLEKESGNIDSVNVSIPDHMHGSVGMAAVAKGLNVYGQKPLAQNLVECRTMTERARAKGVMTQMGIQISSDFTERFTVEMIHSGVIGKVKEVHSFSFKKWGDPNPLPEKSDPIPEGFDWNKWLGVAAERPYLNGYYHPSNWRKRRDFGTGTLGDMGCHMFSGWFRSLALTSPISVTSRGPAPTKDNWALNGLVEYIFPGTPYTEHKEVRVTWYDGDQKPPQEVQDLVEGKWPDQGSLYIGTEGVLLHPHGSTPTLHPKEKFKDFRYPKLEPRDHWADFIDCCLKGDKKPSANWDYAGPLTEAVLLGCLCSLFPHKTLDWNGPRLVFDNSPEATALVHRSYRKGWEIAGL
jgi:predicted dehydrogenase